VIEQSAKKHKVQMELRESGSKGIVVFSVLAKIREKETRLDERIERGIGAMKEAYALINQV